MKTAVSASSPSILAALVVLALLAIACPIFQNAVTIENSTLPVQIVWQYSSKAGEVGPMYGTPEYAEGKVYFTSGSELHALNALTGGETWRYDAKGFISNVRAADRFVVLYAQTGWVGETLTALDAEGEMVWEHGGEDFHSLCLSEDTLFVALEGYVRAYDLATGEQLWDNPEAGESHWNTQLVCESGAIYVQGRSLRVVNPITGEILQEFRSWSVLEQTIAQNGILYTSDRDNRRAVAIDGQTGLLIWSTRYEPTGDHFTTFALADGVLYVPDRDGKVLALDSEDGTLLWQYQSSPRVQVLSNIVVFGDVVYAVFSDDTLRGIDAGTGQEVGRLRAAGVDPPTEGGPIGIAKIATADSLLLVTFDGATLLALQPQ